MTDDQTHQRDPFTVLGAHLGIPRGQIMNMTREQVTALRADAATDLAALVRRGGMRTVPSGDGGLTDDQTNPLPSGYRPRRAPSPPRLAEEDRPDAEEVERRRQATRRRLTASSGHGDRPNPRRRRDHHDRPTEVRGHR